MARGNRGGRPPKPPHMHLVEGTHRRDRHGTRSDATEELRKAVTGPVPACPRWLGKIARACWKRHAKSLHATGRLTGRDVEQFAVYCQSFEDYRQAERNVRKHGHSVATGDGGLKANPAVTAMHQAANRMRALSIEFGMTPVARARSGGGGAKGQADEERAALSAMMRGRSS